MAILNLTPEEFADIALLFLADKAVNPEKVVTGNEEFNTFMKRNASQIKSKLLKYYLDSEPERRRDYKLIKKIFQQSGSQQSKLSVIRIGPEKVIKGVRKEKKKAKSLITTIIKKLLTKKKNEVININKEELYLVLEFIEEEE